MKVWGALAIVAALALSANVRAQGQGRGGRAGGPPQTARAAATQDLTGYWVSVVTEHWHLRMLVPPKGDFSMLPVNAEARRIANMWDPAKDKASGNECAAYGAAGIMRIPSRLHITWADDNTMKMDIDSGMQSRTFHFGPAASESAGAEPTLQGYSVAQWEPTPGRGRTAVVGAAGNLHVTTTRMKAGYLRKNGVPYSDRATLQEFYDSFTEPNGDRWLLDTLIVTDPVYLTDPYVTTVNFKKIPDQAGWDPTPCRADQAR